VIGMPTSAPKVGKIGEIGLGDMAVVMP
jgi:hypothetical protein